MNSIADKYIGLIPAAGYATRLNLNSGSKEIYPITSASNNGEKSTFPVCKCLLDIFATSGVNNVYIVTRKEKKDIQNKLSTGEEYNLTLKYIYCNDTYGPPYTLDHAYEIVKDNYYIALGFPDILLKPNSSLVEIIKKQKETNADVVLALYKTDTPKKADMVEFDEEGNIQDLNIKPINSSLEWTWTLAVWNPKFSEYMHHFLKKLAYEYKTHKRTECHVGTVFNFALKDGIKFEHVFIHDGEMLDIGTIEDLEKIQKNSNLWFT